MNKELLNCDLVNRDFANKDSLFKSVNRQSMNQKSLSQQTLNQQIECHFLSLFYSDLIHKKASVSWMRLDLRESPFFKKINKIEKKFIGSVTLILYKTELNSFFSVSIFNQIDSTNTISISRLSSSFSSKMNIAIDESLEGLSRILKKSKLIQEQNLEENDAVKISESLKSIYCINEKTLQLISKSYQLKIRS